jgi:hypothetical protein
MLLNVVRLLVSCLSYDIKNLQELFLDNGNSELMFLKKAPSLFIVLKRRQIN